MAYQSIPSLSEEPDIGERTREFLDDISSREEFLRYRVAVRRDTGSGFKMHGEQKFIREFQNPHTSFTRCLLNWWTGTGKTNTAIDTSLEFIKHTNNDRLRPSVYVIGFTKDLFIDAMLIRPEFGFISKDELNRLKMLRLAMARGTIEVNHYTAYLGSLRRRITDPSRGGVYQFYGFKEFANRLFKITMKGLEKDFNIQSVFSSDSLDDIKIKLDEAIEDRLLEINTDLIENMRGCLMIVDEIHNTYNIREKNTYGISIQYALNELDTEEGELSIRALYLSATPMTGSVTEIVDLLNLLVPRWYLKEGGYDVPLRKNVFFDEGNNLLPGALDLIGRLCIGRVSFLYDTNRASYPERIIEGVGFPQIPYLKFVLCEMSPYHYNGFRSMLKEARSDQDSDDSKTKVPLNSYSVYDIAFPSEKAVTFKTEEIVSGLSRASEKWLTKTGIRIDWRQEGERIPVISGPFMKHIEKYSAKYAKMIHDVVKFISTKPGKILIYHDRVQLSGVLLLEELLKQFGILEYDGEPTDHTLCAICGKPRKSHRGHEFTPARFVSLHYGIDHSSIRHNLEKFDSPANVDGYMCRILLGARMVQEGHDFNAIRLQLILSCPSDISTLIQLLGRSVRSQSHTMLPPEDRNVRVKIYVTVPKISTTSRTGELTFELGKYETKMAEYRKIQSINKILWTYAVDAYVNELRIQSAIGKEPTLEALPFKTPIRPGKINYSTFYAYGYSNEDVDSIKFAIWSLFDKQKIWSYEDLFEAVKQSSFTLGVEENSQRFSEENFALALRQVMRSKLERRVIQISGPENIFVVVPISEKGPVVDIEVYDREQPDVTPIMININEYVEKVRSTSMFERQLKHVCSKYESGEKPTEFALVEEIDEFHYNLMKLLIIDERRIMNSMKESGYPNALHYLKSLYEDYKLLLTPAVLKESGISVFAGKRQYVGYFTRTEVLVYDKDDWREYPRSTLKYTTRFEENDKIVGFIDKKDGVGKFKLRKPMNVVTKGVRDLRSIDRGMVCGSMPREKQVEYLRGISKLFSNPSKVLEISDTADVSDMPSLCTQMYQALLSLEYKERKKARGMENGTRFVYLFNDTLPAFTMG